MNCGVSNNETILHFGFHEPDEITVFKSCALRCNRFKHPPGYHCATMNCRRACDVRIEQRGNAMQIYCRAIPLSCGIPIFQNLKQESPFTTPQQRSYNSRRSRMASSGMMTETMISPFCASPGRRRSRCSRNFPENRAKPAKDICAIPQKAKTSSLASFAYSTDGRT